MNLLDVVYQFIGPRNLFVSFVFLFLFPPPWNHSPSLKNSSLIRGKAKTLEDLNQKNEGRDPPAPTSSNRTSPPSHLIKIKICWRQIFEILTIYITFPGDMLSPTQNLGPDRFSRFDVYWIQTNRQTSKVYKYITFSMSLNTTFNSVIHSSALIFS